MREGRFKCVGDAFLQEADRLVTRRRKGRAGLSRNTYH
jgi:hypothetical protein